jgi:Outer membrane cytochrome MtrC/MtrF-like, domains II/IV
MKRLKWLKVFLVAGCLVLPLVMAGCSGDDGSNGAAGLSAYQIAVNNGFTGTEQEWLASLDPTNPTSAANNVQPESCSTCHNGTVARTGTSHQDQYNGLFQQGVVVVDPASITYANDGTNDTITFNMTKNGVAYDCTTADALNIGFSQYDAATRSFTAPSGSRINLKGTVTYLGAGVCQSVKAQTSLGDLSATNGVIAVYGRDLTEPVEFEGTHLALAKTPFGSLKVEGTVDYASDANVTGCEKCHQVPYYKHGYIIGDASGNHTQDFWTCKVCHIDNGPGHDQSWQISVDNPQRWAEIFNGSALTTAEQTQYAYNTRLMNDVHMSHAMEFPYPQSMRNCATCHEGKLTQTLSDANFVLETCKSCHPITGGTDTADASGNFAVDTRDMALKTIWANLGVSSFHVDASGNVTATPCNNCHKDAAAGGIGKTFSQIHTGYDPLIYDTAGNRYSTGITAQIDSVTQTGNVLDIQFSATGTVGGLNATDITPTVQVAFYGYDTKDFLVSNHSRDTNGNRMEFTLGSADNVLFTTVANNPGSWEVKMDMAAYGATPSLPDMIAAGTIKRAEVAVLPALKNAAGDTVGLDAPSMTFNLTTGTTEPDYYQGTSALVSVSGDTAIDPNYKGTKGCNSCHDQLATTFHSGNRGGNIVVCRMCHVVTSGGSHLEGQSRSIDSYVHAIHTFQAFNIDGIDFTDPVEAALYAQDTEFLFPDFGVVNCEACHTQTRAVDAGARGAYDVPDQGKSLPGVLSATDAIPGINIGATPAEVTGPAERACGACHRGEAIKENEANEFASITRHMGDNGYRIDVDSTNQQSILDTVIKNIMAFFQ